MCDTLAAVTTLCVSAFSVRDGAVWHPLFAERPEWADEYRSAARFRRHRHAPRPRDKLQRVSGLQSFSNALVTVLTPAAASAVLAFGGLDVVILIDLATFASAFSAWRCSSMSRPCRGVSRRKRAGWRIVSRDAIPAAKTGAYWI